MLSVAFRLTVLAGALCGALGCATPALRSPVAGAWSKKKPAAEEEPAVAKRRPFTRGPKPVKSKLEAPAPSKSAEPEVATQKPDIEITPAVAKSETPAKPSDAPATKSVGNHDATTQALIEAELRDADPAEREDWKQQLAEVPSEMVPGILAVRRSSLARRDAPAAAEAKPEVVADAAGLGARTPWRQASEPAADAFPAEGSSRRIALSPALPPASSSPAAPSAGASPIRTASVNDAASGAASGSANGTAGSPPPETGRPRTFFPDLTHRTPEAAPPQAPVSTASPRNSTPVGSGASWTERLRGNLIPGQFFPPAAAPAPTAPNPLVTASAAAPQVAPASGDAVSEAWVEQLQRLIASTSQEVATLTPGQTETERQYYTERHVHLRMLYLMAGQQERALQYIPGLDPADQEFWQQTFWGLTNYFETREVPNPADRASQTVAQLNQAVLRLKEKANLELRNVTFCHTINSYGSYERYPRDEFAGGQEVLVYSELGNFHSELTADGRFRTLLRSWLEIRTPGPDGKVIQKIADEETSEDLCRNHRRDYFLSYRVQIPNRLPRGPYALYLTVEDQLSRKLTTTSINFTIN